MSSMPQSNEDPRRPEEIEDDIERTRAEVSSTLDAIQSRLTPGQMMDQALQYLRSSGTGEFGSNLGRTVRENPVPVALIGVGIAWLAMGGGGPRPGGPPSGWGRTMPRGAASTTWSTDLHGESMSAGTTRYGDDEPGYGSRIASAGGEALHRTSEAASGMASRVGETVSGATGRVREAISGTASRARSAAHGASERLGDLREGLRHRAGSVQGRTRMQVRHARSSTMRMIDEQPLVLGAIGVAIGAALGAALPATRREDRLMGEVRDDLVHTAEDRAREHAHDVAATAQRVTRSAREQAERKLDDAVSSASGSGSGTPGDRPTAGTSSGSAPGAASAAGATPASPPGATPGPSSSSISQAPY